MATIYEIAKLAGVSTTTVSKVINNYPDVSDKTRKKIKKILEKENFLPNAQAQGLTTKKTWTLGVVYFEDLGIGLSHPFFSKVIEAFKKQADKHGYSLLFGSKNDRLKNTTFLEYFKYKSVDGIAIICSDPNDKETLELIESDFPIVVIDMLNESTSTVTSDNEYGCKIAIEYLFSLGHKKIAHINGTDQIDNLPSMSRMEAYKKYIKEFKLYINKDYIVNGKNFDFDSGYEGMNKLLKLKNPPTAVVCASDKIALGAIKAVQNNGLKVPEDISVIGFDDIELAEYVTPRLTTIRQNCDEIGKAAIDILVEQINKKEKLAVNKVIPVELVIRESCTEVKE